MFGRRSQWHLVATLTGNLHPSMVDLSVGINLKHLTKAKYVAGHIFFSVSYKSNRWQCASCETIIHTSYDKEETYQTFTIDAANLKKTHDAMRKAVGFFVPHTCQNLQPHARWNIGSLS